MTIYHDSDSIAAMDKRVRASFINSITGFKPANLIGTADSSGHSNLAIMSSVVHLGSHPPLLALIIRPNPVERHTLDNILETGVYTINHVTSSFVDAAHQTAARYPRDTSEFDATGLTELWIEGFGAPFVQEAAIRIGLQLRDQQTIAINQTHLVIGEIVHAQVPQNCVTAEGAIDIEAAGSVALSGLDSYHEPRRVKRMAYAKPDLPPREID
jgi:flavin reductase (DIM6/NTAB) family NADH-FMN oxidoreductase RutF